MKVVILAVSVTAIAHVMWKSYSKCLNYNNMYNYTYSPVNLIHETKDRWVYAAAFGSLTGQLLTLIIAGGALTPITISNEYVNNVFKGT